VVDLGVVYMEKKRINVDHVVVLGGVKNTIVFDNFALNVMVFPYVYTKI
jgi:hypothetical protein